ncbi:MAG: malto-oligosyltrehalose synthase, partial [Nitrospinota bacterium]
LMAKGLEDTCFYRFNRFLALNEVGGAPDRFGISVEDFHANCLKRSERTPHSFLATSTHDTKRSEDVRARICALSEFPGDWRTKTSKWSKWNESKKTEVDQNDAPDKNDEYLFYQILLGIWPVSPPDEEGLASLMVRLEEYMIKAIREAKVHTSWININLPYEGATIEFIKKVLFSPARHPFWKDFVPFHQKISHLGFLNSLSQTALKLTCPGVPDIYQGTEFFNFSLVDPDNRRAVDYKQASRTVEEIENFVNDKTEAGKADYRKLLPFETGKVKFFLTITLLRFRQKHSALFRKGSYLPLDVLGEKSGSVIAFARVHENERLIVVVPRLMAGLVAGQSPFPVGLPCWGNTKVVLPGSLQGRTWKTIIEDSTLGSRSGAMKLAEIFDQFPIGALYSQ